MEKSKINIKDIIVRLKDALNVDTDSELSGLLGITKRNIAAWKQRNSIDYQFMLEFAAMSNINIDWLFFGKDNQIHSKKDKQKDLKCPHCGEPLQITIG